MVCLLLSLIAISSGLTTSATVLSIVALVSASTFLVSFAKFTVFVIWYICKIKTMQINIMRIQILTVITLNT